MTANIEEEFSLTPEECQSALWKKLEAHFKTVIEQEHKILERFDINEAETNRVRAIIMCMRVLVSLNPENEEPLPD